MTPDAQQPQREQSRNQNDEPLFTYDQVTTAICFFHANGRAPTLNEMRGGIPLFAHPHTPASQQGTSKLCFGTQHPSSECCQQCNELETCKKKQSYLDYDKQEAARAATLATLQSLEVELRKIKYTSFTGVMEIIDSLRKQQEQQR